MIACGNAWAGDAAAVGGGVGLQRAQALFDAGEYARAVAVLEEEVAAAPRSAPAFLLLGKAYGRLAEGEPWYRAAPLARRCGEALERAVKLAPESREALATLARFYEEAPAVVGGGARKAEALRARLASLVGE